MAFYDLEKKERAALAADIGRQMREAFLQHDMVLLVLYFSDNDTYIRKTAYTATGRIYAAVPDQQDTITSLLQRLAGHPYDKVRQTAVNAAGEIGKTEFERMRSLFDQGLFDPAHVVRNAVIGSIKKMGAVNPGPVLAWAREYLHHPDKEIRREICHGIELRGRTHPGDILPLLQALQWDETARVRNTLVHVIGQIAYKKGCLEQVASALLEWDNNQVVQKALAEIVSVHHRYRNFAALRPEEARAYLAVRFDGIAQLPEDPE
ncbi:HEAT repeat domain-containing protein [Taibaiella koreensis]|uniref:HEAT repeat domain-containing protein n=1 Tax=Taibaiella koreensis TaxID=1268548 RepID=UPI000E59AE98|nr:HEAT repeat domain-containing protein [Taibaiella koreensis]